MHKEQVTHNDLKPQNFYLDKEGHFHISDLDAATTRLNAREALFRLDEIEDAEKK